MLLSDAQITLKRTHSTTGYKTGLDSDILKNYNPVSNLTFISKVIGNVVSGRLNEHLIKNSMFDPLQSAYRDKHSTETASI